MPATRALRRSATTAVRTLRLAVYLRISSDREGEEHGVTRQREDCEARAALEGWTIVAEYCDNDRGASDRSRKPRARYAAMVEAAGRGEFDVILSYSNSRLTRRPLELEGLLRLHARTGVTLATIVSGEDDLSTADGRMVARIKASVDAAEAERIAERVSRAARQRAEQGRPNGGRRPFGFHRDAVSHRAAEAEALRDATQRIINGDSLRSVATAWNARGLTTATGAKWVVSNLRQVLLRARNAGLMEDGRPAIWEPIITGEERDALVTILTDPARLTHGGVSRKLVGSGIYICGKCRRKMRSGGNGAAGQPRYACSGPDQCIRRNADPIDDLVRRVIVTVLRRDGVALLRGKDQPDVSAERARLSALRATARELPGLVGAGIMTGAEFKAAKLRNEEEIAALAAVVERVSGPTPLAGIADADDAGAAFLAADPDRQRAVIAELATVTVMPLGPGKRFTPESVQISPKEQR
jgi:DNA invertase Pin-like site-specific DNA recombinase